MRAVYFTAAAMSVAVSSPVEAQEVGGPYIGAIVGQDSVGVEYGNSEGDNTGLMYGVVAGFDVGVGSAIVGIEGEFAETEVGYSEPNVAIVGDRAELSAGRDLYIGGRLGFQAMPALRVYGKAGYANTRLSVEYDSGADFVFDEGATLDGVRVGAGLELSLTGMLKARAEYRFTHYGEYRNDEFLDDGIKLSRNQVIVGLISSF